ncbi:MAG: hemolysin family protein [Flavobacteriales bacterium Tduv]
MITYICIISITLILSAFFSGMEMAFVSCDRFQIELEKKKNTLRSRLLTRIVGQPREFIATMLIGNNIALVIYGIYMGRLIGKLLFPIMWSQNEDSLWGLFLQTCLSTLIILIIAEFLPKLIFRVYAHETLHFFIIPIYSVFKLLSPVTRFIMWISNDFLKLLGNKEKDQVKIFDKEDLGLFISEKIQDTEPSKIESEVEIFHKALDFSQIKARESMAPRKEMIAVELDTPIEDVSRKFTDEGLSKIIIYKDNVDNIIGYIHYLELFKKPQNLRSILLPIEFVHETMPAQAIMNMLIKKRKSVAIVLDEYGGTAGLITIEDVLEELLGNIEDEHDKVQYTEKKIGDHKFLFSARLEIDYLNNRYKLELPQSEDYETLGGFIVSHTEDIPKEGEILTLNDFYFEVKKVSKNKIEEVLLRKYR